MKPDWATDAETAILAARAAGRAALPLQHQVPEQRKADDSPVSAADHAADEAVRAVLGTRSSGDAILSEEREADVPATAERVWIIDPIDGTRAYLDGSDEWAVHVALVVEGRLRLGVVYAPAGDDCALGVLGADPGAYWIAGNGHQTPASMPRTGPDVLLVSSSRRNREAMTTAKRLLPEFEALSVSSVGVKALRLLEGDGACYFNPSPLAVWDVAAPAAVALAAGGVACDADGQGLHVGHPFAACNGLFLGTAARHPALLQRLQPCRD